MPDQNQQAAFNPNAPYQSVSTPAAPSGFDPNAPYQSVSQPSAATSYQNSVEFKPTPEEIETFKSWPTTGPTNIPGMVAPGNIDLTRRPLVHRNDGQVSSLYSASFGTDKGEVLVPLISDDGRVIDINEAQREYAKTGRSLGVFKTPEDADRYAQMIHEKQGAFQTWKNNGKYNPTIETYENRPDQSTGANKATISPTPQPTVLGIAKDVVSLPTDPIGTISKALDSITSAIENYTQEGRAEHPYLAELGDLTRNAKEMLTGGQSAGKPMGTTSGVANNPVTTAISLAPAAAEGAEAATEKIGGAIEAARANRTASAAARAVDATKAAETAKATEAARTAEVAPEQFTYREATPAPQHGAPVKVASPLDDATIKRLPGGKDLSSEAIDTIQKHIGGEPGQEIPAGSSPKNILHKASEGVQETLTDTGLKMNKVIQNAPAFKTSVANDGKLDGVIDAVRDNLPGGDEEKLNAAIDKELQSAESALQSTDPSEVLAYRRKLGTQIDWTNIAKNPETTGEAQNVAKVKIYNVLGDKIHADIPDTQALDKIFQPNLEAQSFLDKNGVSRDPVAANAEHVSEFNKGKTQLENDAHNEVVGKNRELAGLPKSDVDPTIGQGETATTPFSKSLDDAIAKFKAPPSEQASLRRIIQPSISSSPSLKTLQMGTNVDWFKALDSFDQLTDQQRAARFADPAATRAILSGQAKAQALKAVAKYGSIALAAHVFGIDKAILQSVLK